MCRKMHARKSKELPFRTMSRFKKLLQNTRLKAAVLVFHIALLFLVESCECYENGLPSISQISPKSQSNLDAEIAYLKSSSQLSLEASISESITYASLPHSKTASLPKPEQEAQTLARAARSASPILNDNLPKSGPNEVHFPSDKNKEATAGRYFQYNIQPTSTSHIQFENPKRTKAARGGKTLGSKVMATEASITPDIGSDSFLLKGDLRPLTSRSPISPMSSIATSMAATATTVPHNPRQNPNPDIQDIITGIVKLLNGNVNVHANTQGLKRPPTASRINNRGPPRISDVQTLPLDYDSQKPASLGTSIRPPLHPFERPQKPFITGVPIPEQIVPYRPGFISNRPPWHRNKPRPPITTTLGGQRPIPQYKPLPSSNLSPPREVQEQQLMQNEPISYSTKTPITHQGEVKDTPSASGDNDVLDVQGPIDESDSSNEDDNAQYIEVSDQESDMTPQETMVDDLNDELQPPPPDLNQSEVTEPEEHKIKENGKRKPDENDVTDMKKRQKISTTVNTINAMTSAYLPIPTESVENESIDSLTEEVIFMTPSKTNPLHIATSPVPSVNFSPSLTVTPISPAETSITASSISDMNEVTTIDPTTTFSTTTSTNTIIISSSMTEKDSAYLITSAPPAAIPTTSTTSSAPNGQPDQYHPRPGIVLDDPEFQPGGRPRPKPPKSNYGNTPVHQLPSYIQPTRQHLPPGYGEIFDVTLSAIQGPGSGSGSQQTINIKPYGGYNSGAGAGAGAAAAQKPNSDVILSAAGEDGFVSIDGKRTYINLFGDPTDAPTSALHTPTTPSTAIPQLPSGGGGNNSVVEVTPNQNLGASYGVPETEVVELEQTKAQTTTQTAAMRPHYRQRPTQPPVRIDTCIVGDDSTCDQAQHEHCKTDNGVSSCHCRPSYSRRKHREPCRKVITFFLSMRVDKIYEHRIIWDQKLLDRTSEPYGQLSYESIRAIDSAMSMTPYSDEFMEAKVNNIYRGDQSLGGNGVFVNLTIKLDESVESLRPNLRSDVQKHLMGVLHRRNNNIGNSVLFVNSPEGAVSALQDLNECHLSELNDCHSSATCFNTWGSFYCMCAEGLRDPWVDQPQRAGRDCQSCADTYCNNHGTCSFNNEGSQMCSCLSGHYGSQCEIDGEVLGVAIGASVAAVIIIVLTLVCLVMWSRRWQREQKSALSSPVFGYMNTVPLKTGAALAQAGYQVTLEDRMRWAQIADVMAQTNHYGAEPIAPTRPSSAMFAYPNLQTIGMSTIGGMSMQMHQNGGLAPPVPLPRVLGLGTRSSGMRTLENSSSSEEEDQTDLLGRKFQVPRPKSRSNGSIANQSGIYYDVDYEPSGNGIGNTSVDHLYGSQNQGSSHTYGGGVGSHMSASQNVPMSTYTSGRTSNSYYMK